MSGVQDALERGVGQAADAAGATLAAPGLPLTPYAAREDGLAPAFLAAIAIHGAVLGVLLLATVPAHLPEIAETPAVSMVFEQATPLQPTPTEQQAVAPPPIPPAQAEPVQPPDAAPPPDLAKAEPVPDIQAMIPPTPDALALPETPVRPRPLNLPRLAGPVLRTVPSLPALPRHLQIDPMQPRAPSQASAAPEPTRTDAASPQRPSSPPPQVAATSGPSMGAWRDALMAWLERHKTYPEAAREEGTEGRVLIRFTMSRDGRVIDAGLARSSGSRTLDAAALELVRAAHLPPFPAGVAQETLTATVPLTYQLE